MLRHIAIFRFEPDTTAAQIEHMTAGLRSLPDQIPEIRDYRCGPDAGLREGNWEYAVVADFDDVDDWRTYVEHPVHQAMIAERISPIITERTAVQYEW